MNEDIVGVREVRLISDTGDSTIMSFAEALRRAEEEELDLVEIAAQATPPVCKILDFQKFRYAEEKRGKESAKKQRVANKMQEIKEVRYRPVTDENDYQIKTKSIVKFLEEGYRVKATVRFRGREMTRMDFGTQMIERLISDVANIGSPESTTRPEGKNLFVTFVPKKAKQA